LADGNYFFSKDLGVGTRQSELFTRSRERLSSWFMWNAFFGVGFWQVLRI